MHAVCVRAVCACAVCVRAPSVRGGWTHTPTELKNVQGWFLGERGGGWRGAGLIKSEAREGAMVVMRQYFKRDLMLRQKRPTVDAKET